MQKKILLIAFVASTSLLMAVNSYALSEMLDDPDAYSNSSFNDNTNDMNNDPSIRETERELYDSPREISGYTPFSARLPREVPIKGQKFIIVDPKEHVWGAYSASGRLVRAGLASAGKRWCDDIDSRCKTKPGIFHIYSLGDSDCVSNEFPVDQGGGAPMPYCMFFNGAEALHGSDELAEANISHGCVRISIEDAEWLRYHFVHVGTVIIIEPY